MNDRPIEFQFAHDCKTIYCGQPAEPNDNETPLYEDTPNDCKKWACRNSAPAEIADDQDPPDPGANPDNACKKCQNKSAVADTSKNALACPDEGNPSCSIDTCANGICNHKEVSPITPYSPDPYQPNPDLSGTTEATKAAITCLKGKVHSASGTFTLTSAWRPQSYQDHLNEVWNKWEELKDWPEEECLLIASNAKHEKDVVHGLVHQPSHRSNHTVGISFDASISLQDSDYIDIYAAECGLYRPLPFSDPVHFTYIGP